MTMQLTAERLEQLIAPTLDAEGLTLCGIVISGNFSNPLIQIFVDYEEKSLSIDDCVTVTRLVQDIMDIEFTLPGYRLEVSSPGIERPLAALWQFRKNRGRLYYRQSGTTIIQGRIMDVNDDETVTIETPDGTSANYPLAELKGGKIVLETYAKPKSKPKRKRNETRGR